MSATTSLPSEGNDPNRWGAAPHRATRELLVLETVQSILLFSPLPIQEKSAGFTTQSRKQFAFPRSGGRAFAVRRMRPYHPHGHLVGADPCVCPRPRCHTGMGKRKLFAAPVSNSRAVPPVAGGPALGVSQDRSTATGLPVPAASSMASRTFRQAKPSSTSGVGCWPVATQCTK